MTTKAEVGTPEADEAAAAAWVMRPPLVMKQQRQQPRWKAIRQNGGSNRPRGRRPADHRDRREVASCSWLAAAAAAAEAAVPVAAVLLVVRYDDVDDFCSRRSVAGAARVYCRCWPAAVAGCCADH